MTQVETCEEHQGIRWMDSGILQNSMNYIESESGISLKMRGEVDIFLFPIEHHRIVHSALSPFEIFLPSIIILLGPEELHCRKPASL